MRSDNQEGKIEKVVYWAAINANHHHHLPLAGDSLQESLTRFLGQLKCRTCVEDSKFPENAISWYRRLGQGSPPTNYEEWISAGPDHEGEHVQDEDAYN